MLLRIKLINHTLIAENEFREMVILGSEVDGQLYLKHNDLYLIGAKIYDLEFNKLCGYYAY